MDPSLTSILATHPPTLPNLEKVKRRPYLSFTAWKTKSISLQKHYH